MTATHPYEEIPQLREVALQLGWLVVYCTELEWLAFQALRSFEPDKERATLLADEEFKRRVTSVIKVSRANLKPSDSLDDWLKVWDRVCSFADERNAILHNPFFVNVYEDNLGRTEVRHELHTFRNPASRFDGKNYDSIRDAVQKAASYSRDAFRLYPLLTAKSGT